jgi:hypothetical protein
MAGFLQSTRNKGSDLLVILHHQDTHSRQSVVAVPRNYGGVPIEVKEQDTRVGAERLTVDHHAVRTG